MSRINWTDYRKAGVNGDELTIGHETAREIIASIDADALASLAAETEKYLPDVLAEMDTLLANLSHNYDNTVRSALLFAISTPNTALTVSLNMMRYFRENLPETTTDASMVIGYLNPNGKPCGLNGVKNFQNALSGILPILQNPRQFNITRDLLMESRGIGIKVATMAMAIINPYAAVWTVDRHHLRQLLAMAGRTHNYSAVALGSGKSGQLTYATIEAFYLSFAATYFPNVPVWAVQWACWNAAAGQHRSHKHIWEQTV